MVALSDCTYSDTLDLTGGTADLVYFGMDTGASPDLTLYVAAHSMPPFRDSRSLPRTDDEIKEDARQRNRLLSLVATRALRLRHSRPAAADASAPTAHPRTPTRRRTATAVRNFRRAS